MLGDHPALLGCQRQDDSSSARSAVGYTARCGPSTTLGGRNKAWCLHAARGSRPNSVVGGNEGRDLRPGPEYAMSSLSTRQGQHKSIRSSFSCPFPTFGGKKKSVSTGRPCRSREVRRRQEPQESGVHACSGKPRGRVAGGSAPAAAAAASDSLHPRGRPRPSIPAALPPPTPDPPTSGVRPPLALFSLTAICIGLSLGTTVMSESESESCPSSMSPASSAIFPRRRARRVRGALPAAATAGGRRRAEGRPRAPPRSGAPVRPGPAEPHHSRTRRWEAGVRAPGDFPAALPPLPDPR